MMYRKRMPGRFLKCVLRFGDGLLIKLLAPLLDRVAKSPGGIFCSTESEKCHFHFPYKSMTYIAGH
jgi:hypothetical protein